MRLLFALSLLSLLCAAARGDEPPRPGPGVSRELARWRAAHYRDVRYLLSVRLERGAELMRGELRIRVVLDSAAGDLVLDWRVTDKNVDPASRVSDIHANGREVRDARFEDEHVRIPRQYLKRGENVVTMSFASPVSTSGSAVTRYLDREDNSEYVYTLFVPSDASTAFPCFDQPDLKARFTLRVTAPESWTVVSNAEGRVQPEFDDTSGGLPQSPPAGARWHWFAETEPVSTYQFAFAAGPFAEFKDEGSAYKTRLFVRRSKAERAKKESAEVFRLNRGALKFFEDYFAHKFPFTKYDLVLLPEFAYGGMEHAGATFLREESVLFPSDPTAGDLLSRADVMLHEAAHQWFGDLVTMRWFDDLWLKEGFATFMAYKAVAALMPEYDAWKVFHLRNKPLAYLTDVTKGTTPIFQEIANLSAAKSAYGNIVYRKAPSMLRQAEFYLGEREFRDAVRLVVREHAYANATWDDLVRAFERTSRRKLGAWADAWVKRRGMPDVRAGWDYSPGDRSVKLILKQRDVLGEGGVWPMRVKVILVYEGGAAHVAPVLLSGDTAAVNVASPGGRPSFVFANSEDYGYGRFLLDEVSRAYVVKNLGAVRDDFLRALLWGSLWDSVREAEMAPADFVELAIREAARERDDVALQFILSRAATAFTRYLSEEQRQRLAPRFEAMLGERMMKAETAGLRITYFRTLREVATGDAVATLRDILTGKLQVPGMTLRARDRFDILRVFYERSTPDPADRKILDDIDKYVERTAREEGGDDARRYAYAARAAGNDPEVKKKYFEQYLGDKDLPESWIEASLSSFNSPRQSALTFPYLAPALGELPALKRTRKIFFVNGWLASFIGGQCDERALGAVGGFLESEKTLDEDLRRKVLEAADGLERCVRIRRRYAAAAP
ncbi:MAG TPA: M1 family aminopeptidase [Pyrinomonadaceae bacterium]|nr:M1 family aminopeptidase [Pyrinomonadaceae bacterium]